MPSSWVKGAINSLMADMQRSADTHLIPFPVPGCPDIHLYLKDESTHPSGSLKHRLARSLFLYGLCNGWIKEGTPIIEASSGSTAVSEAYFARLLGLPFTAVIPASTSAEKIKQIEFYGGQCHLVENAGEIDAQSRALAQQTRGHFVDQFTYAERATDWRGNNNIAQSIFQQMEHEPHPLPTWLVMGAGTGGTSATLGRYIRYQGLDTQLMVVDPENSVFFDHYKNPNPQLTSAQGSRIEGIGRPRVEPSFVPSVIDRMLRVNDQDSLAAMRFVSEKLGKRCGASTGTNIIGAFTAMAEMKKQGLSGSVVTLICDPGERYLDTYYSDTWCNQQDFDLAPCRERLNTFFRTGEFPCS